MRKEVEWSRDEGRHRSRAMKLAWLTRDSVEVWRVDAGMEAASQNNASAARSVLAMWLTLV